MNISYDHYRVFYHVAKCGSITQAAHMLFHNQPNITRIIKNLESELGCVLFIRTKKGVKLTAEGELLYNHISMAFEHIKLGEEEISLGQSMQKGLLSIGASEIALRCYLLPILNQYRERYPNIRIRFFNMTTPQAIATVQDELVDIAFTTTPIQMTDSIQVNTLKQLQEVLVCGQVLHNQIGDKELTLEDLVKLPLVSLGKQTATYAMYNDIFSQKGLEFSPSIEAATADQIIPMVKHNFGLGFTPLEFLSDDPDANGLYVQPLKEKIPPRHICSIVKKDKTLRLPAQKLLDMLLTQTESKIKKNV